MKETHVVRGPDNIDDFLAYTSKIVQRNKLKAGNNLYLFYQLCRNDGVIIEDVESFMEVHFGKKPKKKPKSTKSYKAIRNSHTLYEVRGA